MTLFEHPKKTEVRHLLEEAILNAGYELVKPPERIELPGTVSFQGGILGDAQCTREDGTRSAFYVHIDHDRAIPQWLVKLARASQEVDGVEVFAVSAVASDLLKDSCEVSGCGLLIVDDTHSLEIRVEPRKIDPTHQRREFEAEVSAARSELNRKQRLLRQQLDDDFSEVQKHTARMAEKKKAKYIDPVVERYERLEVWATAISIRIDQVLASDDKEELEAIVAAIATGPESGL